MSHLLWILPLMIVGSAAEGQAAYDPERIAWSRLELEASKFFVTARSEIELASHPPNVAADELIAPAGAAALKASALDHYLMAIRTRFLSQESQVRFWFDSDAQALQRSELSLSKKRKRHRTYRYSATGVHARTLRPADGEDGRPYSAWTDSEDDFTPFPQALDPAAVVTEAASLLYAVPASSLESPGDSTRLYIYSRGQISPVEVTVKARERIAVDYVEVSAKGERRVQEDAETVRVALRPRQPEGGDSAEFKLLGLEGDIDLYLDAETRAPLLMTGKIRVAGSVRLHLKRVVLR
ncbi:MAG: hypothetical protein AAF560_00525 [Acidobacteriota bacterium]